ncbi:MAG: hypothetical protein OEM15_08965 [Myxococcales bacterium]|nr:hypothetical protein [Myxococcales bacterium]
MFRYATLQCLVLALLATGCTDDTASPSGEPIEVVEVPLPQGVTIPSQQNSTGFTVDGSRLFTTVMIEGVEGRGSGTPTSATGTVVAEYDGIRREGVPET